MRVRLNFVSNSSSSSFVIYGVGLDDDEFLELCESLYPEKTSEEIKEIFDDPFGKFQLDINKRIGLDVISDWECEYHLIGRQFKDIGDNETGSQFKKSVQEKIAEILPNENCKTIEVEISC